jgi:putative membrane protein
MKENQQMSRLNILAGRITLAACIALLPVALIAQSGSMSPSPDGAQDQMGTNGPQNKIGASDKRFVRKAAEGGMAEVELGQMAAEKASNPEVKKFGQRMVDDHTKANDQLKEVASSKGIQLPTKLSPKDEMTKQRLSSLKGDDFDKAYMSDMVKDHAQDVADFQRESTSGMDPDVKNFASKTLPTLEDHLKQARQIAPTTSANANQMGGQP